MKNTALLSKILLPVAAGAALVSGAMNLLPFIDNERLTHTHHQTRRTRKRRE